MPGSLPWQFLSHSLQQVQAIPVHNQYSKVQKPKETESHMIPGTRQDQEEICLQFSFPQRCGPSAPAPQQQASFLPLLAPSSALGRTRAPGSSPPAPQHRAGVALRGPCGPQSTLLPAEAPCSEVSPKPRLSRSSLQNQAPKDAHGMMKLLTHSSPRTLLLAIENSVWSSG